MKFKYVDIMKEMINCLHRLIVLTALFCFFAPAAFATPAIPVDRDTFSIGNTITAEISAYGVKSSHTGYKEDDKKFILTAKQSLPGTVQEVEFTAQPFEEMNRYAGKKMEKFYRKGKGGAGKRLNVNIEYKVPPKARMLVVTAQLKDYYQKGSQILPRYTTVEYELRVIGFAEANANQFHGKTVTKVNDSKGKRMIIEKKGTDAAVAAVGIGIPILAALGYWFFHRKKK